MRSPAHPVIWTDHAWPKAGKSATERYESRNTDRGTWIEGEAMVCRRADSGGVSASLRIVGILAFCQALVFVVLFLFLCARRAVATEAKPKSDLELSPSAYEPQNTRDPFGSEIPKAADGKAVVARLAEPDALKLQGILYNKTKPSALVNDQLVELNKTVKVHTDQGEVEVKALEITRELVLLDVGGQKIELRLGGNERTPAAK